MVTSKRRFPDISLIKEFFFGEPDNDSAENLFLTKEPAVPAKTHMNI